MTIEAQLDRIEGRQFKHEGDDKLEFTATRREFREALEKIETRIVEKIDALEEQIVPLLQDKSFAEGYKKRLEEDSAPNPVHLAAVQGFVGGLAGPMVAAILASAAVLTGYTQFVQPHPAVAAPPEAHK